MDFREDRWILSESHDNLAWLDYRISTDSDFKHDLVLECTPTPTNSKLYGYWYYSTANPVEGLD